MQTGQSGNVFVCFYFVFVMNASLSASPEDTTATEMLNPVSGLFNYSYCYCGALAQRVREREGGMEEAAIEERQKEREWRKRTEFSKTRGIIDGICM